MIERCAENSAGDRDREKKEQIKIKARGGGDTGEEVVKYSGRGVDTMGGRGGGGGRERREIRRDRAEGICEELKAAERQLRGKGRSARQTARLHMRGLRKNQTKHREAEKRTGTGRVGSGFSLTSQLITTFSQG